MNRSMSKRKTRKWPDMFPRKKRVYPKKVVADSVNLCDFCISEPICNNVHYG